jgi:hypothetical protein
VVSITVDFKDVSDSLDKLSDTLPEAVIDAIDDVASKIQRTAKTNHRYTRRTGRLAAAVKRETTDDSVTIYIDSALADYGKYIHDGFKSWSPDTFIDDAYAAHERDLSAAIDRAVDDTIKKLGF